MALTFLHPDEEVMRAAWYGAWKKDFIAKQAVGAIYGEYYCGAIDRAEMIRKLEELERDG